MLTKHIQKSTLLQFIPLKKGNTLSIFVSTKVTDLFFIYLYQYQNLGVNLEKLYNVMMDLTQGLKVRQQEFTQE